MTEIKAKASPKERKRGIEGMALKQRLVQR